MKSHAGMNRIYRLVWNAAMGLWVAVAENAKGRSKGGSGRTSVEFTSMPLGVAGGLGGPGGFRLNRTCRGILLLVASTPHLLMPVYAADAASAAVTAGAGSVSTAGNTTTIRQTSQNLAIDWTSLSTRANEALVFNQPNAQAIALNRIIGSSPSELLGSLTANGQVFILNPNGVLFGAGSQVNVGGLVASTLGLSNADFMAGNYGFSGTSTGAVINQGTMTAAPGGYLALLAPEVRNEGVMTASLGTALLAAGNKVTLNLDNGSLLGYSIDQGAVNALAENNQLIKADGGQVLLSAKAMDSLTTATVNNTGVIEARTMQNKAGRILLMGDMETGTVNVGGTLDASAPNGGDGGFIETSAANFNIAPGAKITALAAQGKAGTWLIDPTSVTIAGGAGGTINTIYESDIESAGANVLIQATDSVIASGTFGSGDVVVPGGLNLTIQTTAAGGGTGIDLTSSAHGAALTFKTSGGGNIYMSTGNVAQSIKSSNLEAADGGSITINSLGSVDLSGVTVKTAGGGAISITGAGTSLADGVKISDATVDAGAGDLTITGSSTTGGAGVLVTTGAGATGQDRLKGKNVSVTGNTTGAGNTGIKIDGINTRATSALTLSGTSVSVSAATLDAGGGNVSITGSGASASHSVEIANSSTISTSGAGNITVSGNLTSDGSAATGGTAGGVVVTGSTISAGSGLITITGDAGWTSAVATTARGVRLDSGATITGAGNIAITGRTGTGAPSSYGAESAGIQVASGAKVISTGGNLTLNGTFNNPSASGGKGAIIGGRLESGPAGSLSITGNTTVGNSGGTGLEIGSSAVIKAGTLGLTVTGTTNSSTTATALIGADISGTVSSTGDIALTGIVSAPSAPTPLALRLQGTVTAIGAGNITLNGSGVPAPAPSSSYDLQNYGTITSGGGTISLIGDRIDLQNTVNAGAGRVVIAPKNIARPITLGGTSELNALNLSSFEINQITAGTLVIGGSTLQGGIDIAAAINPLHVSTLSLLNESSAGPGRISQTAGITVANLHAEAANIYLSNASNQISQVSALSNIGNVDIRSASALTVGTVAGYSGVASNAGGSITLVSGGALTASNAAISTSGSLTASSVGGMLLDNAGNSITTFNNIQNTGSGDMILRNTGATFSNISNGSGRIDIRTTGPTTVGSISSSGTSVGGTAATAAISVVSGRNISATTGLITTSGGGSVYVEAGNTSLTPNTNNNSYNLGGSFISPIKISTSGAVTAVASGGASQVNLALSGGATVDNISAPGAVNVTVAAGDLAVKTVSGSAVTLSAAAGAILDANGTANNITATTLNATAANGITLGTNVTGLQTVSTTGATGDISLSAANALNSSNLAISTAAGSAQTVSVSSAAGLTVDSALGNAQDNLKLTASGGNLNVNAALTANNLTLSSAGASAQTAAITATGLELLGTGSHNLNHAGNAVTTLAGNTGDVSYSQSGALAIGTVNTAGLTSSGKVLVRTTGAGSDLTLNNGVTSASTANDSLVLAAGRNFINNAGATPLNPGGGRYLVYATDPAANVLGGMTSPGNAFGRTYAANAPSDVSMTSLSGNRFVYSVVPTLNISGDNKGKVYGGSDPALTYTVNSGLVAGDTAATALAGALSAPTGAATTQPSYAITQGTLASTLGYNIAYASGTLTLSGIPAASGASAGTTASTILLGGDAYRSALVTTSMLGETVDGKFNGGKPGGGVAVGGGVSAGGIDAGAVLAAGTDADSE